MDKGVDVAECVLHEWVVATGLGGTFGVFVGMVHVAVAPVEIGNNQAFIATVLAKSLPLLVRIHVVGQRFVATDACKWVLHVFAFPGSANTVPACIGMVVVECRNMGGRTVLSGHVRETRIIENC